MNNIISLDGYREHIRKLIGMPVSLAWKGYGTAIFLEFGKLSQGNAEHHQYGEFSVFVSWEWRVENGSKVLFGSSCNNPFIVSSLKKLEGMCADKVTITDNIPELEITFSDKSILRTMIMSDCDPEWHIRLPNEKYIYPENGKVFYGEPDLSELSTQEKEQSELAECTYLRWNIPAGDHKENNCQACKYYIGLNGNYNMLDYGVCIAEGSQFDGRIVGKFSQCPLFTECDY